MKKNTILIGVVLIVAFLIVLFFGFRLTGGVVSTWTYCSAGSLCSEGEGDCDYDNHCLTGYCAQNVGLKYGKIEGLDVCECLPSQIWDSLTSTCVNQTYILNETLAANQELSKNSITIKNNRNQPIRVLVLS